MSDADHGSREITKRDREVAVINDIIHSTSPLKITDGMRRALRERPRKGQPHRPWWVRVLYARMPGKRGRR